MSDKIACHLEPEDELPASGTPAPARADHAQAPPVVLEVPPLSLAERTAFIGHESEGGTIRAVIDRALTGHGSIVMLSDGPGVGKSRLAMEMAEYASRIGFRCSVERCYEETNPFPFFPSSRLLKAIWLTAQVWMISVGVWGTTHRN